MLEPGSAATEYGYLIDVNGVFDSIRFNGFGEVSLELDVDRELVSGFAFLLIHAMRTADTEIIDE